MRKALLPILLSVLFLVSFASAGYAWSLDWLKGKLNAASTTKLSDTQIGAGLKEALKVGLENTIKAAGKEDGYLNNQAIRILLPDNLKNVENVLRQLGFGQQVDELVLSMNRAAEKAAPLAADIFATALGDLSFDDAKKILRGGNNAATDFFKQKTYDKLLQAFQPAVHQQMQNYAVTKKFQEIMNKYQSLPFVSQLSPGIELDKYVSAKALDGLFWLLAEEEQKIRTDPAARVTDLLRQVFK